MTTIFAIDDTEYQARRFYWSEELPIEVSSPLSLTVWQKPSYTGHILEIEQGLAVDLRPLLKTGAELGIHDNGKKYSGVITGIKGSFPYAQIRIKLAP